MLPKFLKHAQRGYISLVLIIFALLIAALIFPYKFPVKNSSQGGIFSNSGLTVSAKGCNLYTGTNPPTIRAKSYWGEKYSNLPDEEGMDADDEIEDRIKKFPETSNSDIDYELRISNVPIFMKYISRQKDNFDNDLTGALHQNFVEKYGFETVEINGKKFLRLYPAVHGRLHGATGGAKFRPVKYGLLYLAHLDANGKMIILDLGNNYVLVDVYQDPRAPAIPQNAIDECNNGSQNKQTTVISPGGLSLFDPEQDKSQTKEQLQLEYFLFTRGSEEIEINGAWTIHCKPAIYLYPPKKQLVNVKVFPSGFLTYVDPPYDQSEGWTVWAEPDGKLQPMSKALLRINDKRYTIYDYLYFESKVPDQVINKPTKGWVVKFNELENLYKNILPKLGLNEIQTRDFINYWKKALPEAPYYFVGIIDQANVDLIERLEITPKPGSINRVRIYFERLDSWKPVNPPAVPSIFSLPTSSFHVTEWGGMVKLDPNHPFTCSQ